MTPDGVTRRTLLTTSAAVATGLAASGCAKGDTAPRRRKPGEKITMTFWSWVPGVDKAVDLWNKTHPDVQVKLEKVFGANSSQYAKMHAALRAGNPPDVAQVEYRIIAEFLLEQGLVDLREYGVERHKDKFVGWQWEQVVFAGGVYGIPQASGPMGMYYRTDLFDTWDIEPPATWSEYQDAAQRIRKRGAYIGSFSPNDGDWLTALAWQAGANWIRTDGGVWGVDIDNEPTRRVFAYWEELVRRKLVKIEPPMQTGWYADLQSGRIVNWVGPQWGDALLLGNAPKTSGKWRVTRMPQWKKGEYASANYGGSSTALFVGAPFPHDALDFAIWLNTDPESMNLLIQGGYGWPAAKTGFAGSALDKPSDFFGGQRYNEVFAGSDKAVDTSWKFGPTTVLLNQHIADALSEALHTGGSFTAAVRTVQQRVVADMKDKGLKVEAA